MKQLSYIGLTALCVTAAFAAVTVFAQWIPGGNAPAGNIPQLINVGQDSQIKVGSSAVIGVRVHLDNQFDTDWLSNFTDTLSLQPHAGLVADSVIGVARPPTSSAAIDPEWTFDPQGFALSTNAPISVNGVWSDGPITAVGGFSGNPILVTSLRDGSSSEKTLCSNAVTGELVVCAGGATNKPTVSISVSPTTVPVNTPTTVSVIWSSTNATTCTAVDDAGFTTNGATSGTDQSNSFSLAAGQTQQFALMCNNPSGKIGTAVVRVAAQ